MSDWGRESALLRLLARLADRIEAYVEGDERALEGLAEEFEDPELSAEDLEAVVIVLRGLARPVAEGTGREAEMAPAAGGPRVPSAEELERLSPEAWGYLLELRGVGMLSPPQFEQVLHRVLACGVWPAGVELVREVAERVAMHQATGAAREDGIADREILH